MGLLNLGINAAKTFGKWVLKGGKWVLNHPDTAVEAYNTVSEFTSNFGSNSDSDYEANTNSVFEKEIAELKGRIESLESEVTEVKDVYVSALVEDIQELQNRIEKLKAENLAYQNRVSQNITTTNVFAWLGIAGAIIIALLV